MKTLLLFTKAHDYVRNPPLTVTEGIIGIVAVLLLFVGLLLLDAKINNKKI